MHERGCRTTSATSTMPGVPLQDVWTDIPIALGKERLGYPTQKPLALLERIIKASSNEGDMVLDPFCGCATTLVAADRLQRKWAGIDLSPLAVKLVNDRITHDQGLWGGATVQEEPPKRTDQGKLPNYRTHRHRLYGVQEGVCMGCDTHFPFRVMDVDHILPRARGGTDQPRQPAIALQWMQSEQGRTNDGRVASGAGLGKPLIKSGVFHYLSKRAKSRPSRLTRPAPPSKATRSGLCPKYACCLADDVTDRAVASPTWPPRTTLILLHKAPKLECATLATKATLPRRVCRRRSRHPP